MRLYGPRRNIVEEVIEETKNNNGESYIPNNPNYPSFNQSVPYNIPPKGSIYPYNSMNNNKYPQFNPGQMNNNGPNPENNNNSYPNNQTFNPSQNTYPPQMPNNNYNPNQNYPYPNTLFQNIPQYPNPAYAQNNPEYQNPQYNPNIPEPLNNNLNYPNNPNFINNNININNNIPRKKQRPRPNSVRNNIVKPNYPNYPNDIYNNIYNTSYPQRPLLRFGPSLAYINNKFRTKPQKRQRSPAYIPYGKSNRGRCFACDVDCGISKSGNSPNNYDPYMASYKKPRYDVTFYDGNKYGYYQYSSNLIQENN